MRINDPQTPGTAPRRLQARRGMAMVLVLILVVVMSLGAVAGFARSSSEFATTSNLRAQADAWNVAYSGLERYLVLNTAVPSALPNTATYTLSNGTATVTLEQLRPASGGVQTFLLRSVGSVTNRRSTLATPAATRTITQIVQRQNASLDVDAAFVALSGAAKNGTSGTVTGVDVCGAAATLPGLAVPLGGYTPPNNSANANTYIQGNPAGQAHSLGVGGFGSAAPANAAVRIDWKSVLDGTTLAPDFLINRTATPNTGAFPGSYANWPVVRVQGNITNGDNFTGQGILVVTGDANLSNIQWSGIVLIGGAVTLSGSATNVNGALITGLNMKIVPLSQYPYLPQTYPTASAVGNGNFNVRYNSCNNANALNRFGGWLRVANTFTDNWPAP